MILKSRLSKRSSLFKFMNENKESVKLAVYSAVLLLNINMIMSIHGVGIAEGFMRPSAALQGSRQPSSDGSMIISLILAFISLLGYMAQTCLACLLEAPVVIRRIDQVIDDGMRSLKNPRHERSLVQMFLAVAFTFVLIVMHKVSVLLI